MRNSKKIIISIIFIKFILGLYALGSNEKEAPPTLQMIYEQMSEDVPSAAILNCEKSIRVEEGIVSMCMDDILKYFVKENIYRPYSINTWLTTEYNKKANNICEIADIVKREEIPVDYLIIPNLDKLADDYNFSMTVLPVKDSMNPQYFSRSFTSVETWNKAKLSLFYELKNRMSSKRTPLMPYSLYVDNFPVRLFQYASLSTGEFEFVEVPLSHLYYNDYKRDEDVFKDIVTYDFHSNGILNVISDGLDEYHTGKKYPCEYLVSGEMLLTDRMNMLNISLYDTRAHKKTKLAEFSFPFKDMRLKDMRILSREVVNSVYKQLLTPAQSMMVSYQDLNLSIKGEDLYFEGCNLDSTVQKAFCLPTGCSWFSVHGYVDGAFSETPNVVVAFVSPIDNEISLHNGTDGKYLEKLLAQKGNE